MLRVQQQHSLTHLNSFGFQSVAEYFFEIQNSTELPDLLTYCRQLKLPLLLLGGGSNVILSDRIPGVVALMAMKGQQIEFHDLHRVLLTVAAGESWHETVKYSLEQGCFGLENLALIPGTVGAAPVQNIGAYGVELKDRLSRVEVFDTQEQVMRWLSPSECHFGYRESIFKSIEAGRFIITQVEFSLTTHSDQLNLEYQALRETSEKYAAGDPITPLHVFDAVCYLRQQKLPNPADIGNAGSFFKNPRVNLQEYLQLKESFPDLVGFADGDAYKLAAGWLIEACGWKGKRLESVGVYEKQALVLVNRGGGNRQQIERIASAIQHDVEQRFAVRLEVEPRYYP